MSVELMPTCKKEYVEVNLSGKLTRADYERLVPQFEQWIAEHGKVRLLVRMHHFRGWHISALWEDIKFDAQHFADFERIAIVGEKKWQFYMTAFCKPFTSAQIRYFGPADLEEAKAWLEKGGHQSQNR